MTKPILGSFLERTIDNLPKDSERSGTQVCEARGCKEAAVGFNDDGEALCEDCLSLSFMERAMEEDNWEDDHL